MAKKTKKIESNCPKDFTLIEDEENEAFYGRCKGKRLIQIVGIDSTKNYGLEKGEKEAFLLDLTELTHDDLKLTSGGTKRILENVDKNDYKSFDTLNKALEHKRLGLGDDILLGERNPHTQRKDSAKLFKTKKQAIDFMTNEIPKMDTSQMETEEH